MAKPEHDNMLFDDIVLLQILPRLPARSIGRCMSVCKQWQSFLTTPTFTKMHVHHVNNQNHPKIIAIPNPCNYFCTMDCETPEVGLSASRSLPFEMGSNIMSILSYLNGLVCVGIMPHSRICTDIILWNPLTGDYKRMSNNAHANCFSGDIRVCGLYYSSCDDDYKMLYVTESSDAYIYSWKSGSWRKAAKSSVDFLPESMHRGCLLNENLYFIAKKADTQGTSRELIMRFDTKTETFKEIATPYSSAKLYDMMVVGGCIYLCMLPEIDSDLNFDLWKMDGDEKWAKVIIRYCMSPFVYQPCHLMKNGNWLLTSRRGVVIYKVDRKEEEKEKRECKHAIDNTMRFLLHGKFVETIESLKR